MGEGTLNLPNKITLARIVLIPVFMVFMLSKVKYGDWVAAAVFIIAAASDGLDGYIARSRQAVTVFGQFLDPLADKLLVSGALIALVALQEVSAWVAMLIIGREFAVTALRLVSADRGIVIPAGSLGKAKTIAQIVAIVALMMPIGEIYPSAALAYGYFELVSLIVAVILTMWSGVDYFRAARDVLEAPVEAGAADAPAPGAPSPGAPASPLGRTEGA